MPFRRHADNPILSSRDLPYSANSVFNAAAVELEGDTLLLLRVEDQCGFSHLTLARSRDGFRNWRIAEEPTLPSDPTNHPEELWGIEDPRITRMENGDEEADEEGDLFAIVYTAFSACGPLVSLATTRAFLDFTRWGSILPPEDKDAALFPARFGGRYAMIHRPVPAMPNMGAHMWISFSPDLKHWGDHQILLSARSGGRWDANKIGLSHLLSAPRRVGSSCITGCGTPRPAPSTGWAWPCWICMIPPGFCADRTSGSWVLRLPMSGREMCPGSSSPAAGCSGTASCVSTTGRPTPQSP